jgi:hypothetical protein
VKGGQKASGLQDEDGRATEGIIFSGMLGFFCGESAYPDKMAGCLVEQIMFVVFQGRLVIKCKVR